MAGQRLVVPVVDLLRQPGSRRHVQESTEIDPIVLSSAHVDASATVELDLWLEAQGQGVIVSGVVRAPWAGACRRCLEPTTGIVEARVHEVFSRASNDGETWPLDVDRVDLGPVVHEAVALALPLAPLCDVDCQGPDPERFPAHAAPSDPSVDEAEESSSEPPRDPRWAALDELRFD